MLLVSTSKKTNPIHCRWTTNRRGEYDTQSLDRRLVRGAGGRQVGDHLGDHLNGHLGDHHGNHLSDHLTKHLGNHKHLLKHEIKHHTPLLRRYKRVYWVDKIHFRRKRWLEWKLYSLWLSFRFCSCSGADDHFEPICGDIL